MKSKIFTDEEALKGITPGPKFVTLVTCGPPDHPNIITVSYVGQISDATMVIGIRPQRHSNRLLEIHDRFGINFMTSEFVEECDFCGSYSGSSVDKLKETGFTLTEAKGEFEFPLIAESPTRISCIRYKIGHEKNHDIFYGQVVGAHQRDVYNDWLFHDGESYYSIRNGYLGKIFEIARKL